MTVHRFLVTGEDERLFDFHFAVFHALNAIERRGQTVMYTCFDEDRAPALECAKTCGVTVQAWDEQDQEWKIIVGDGPGWVDTRMGQAKEGL